MTQLSVARALNEIKLLEKRIQKEATQVKAGFIYSGPDDAPVLPAGITSRAEGRKQYMAKFQSVMDLIRRYRALKSAVILSNATTKLTVAGEEMTVAEAIERKQSTTMPQTVAQYLEGSMNRLLDTVQAHNRAVNERAKNAATQVFGDKEKTPTPEAFIQMEQAIIDKDTTKIETIVSEEEIEGMLQAVEDFYSEVDAALNESNVSTLIDVA